MTHNRYIALLRGINVGGKNSIKMTDLTNCFESMGFEAVRTYIQSGNIGFDTPRSDTDTLCAEIESVLSKRFTYASTVVLLLQSDIRQIMASAPPHYGNNPEEYRYDLLFLKQPLNAEEAMQSIRTRQGVDFVQAGCGVIYFSRLISKAGQSYMAGIIKTAIYPQLTIRNYNTGMRLTTL